MSPQGAGGAGPTAQPSRGSEEFSAQVRTMFDRIAGVYDRMNHVMTAGLDRRWRERAVQRAELEPGASALDVCCGTGDLAFELARVVGPGGRVVGCDFSEAMLEIARGKEAARRATEPGGPKANGSGAGSAEVEFEWADALRLPYEDGEFDAVTVGFGVRNLSDLSGGLGEMARVLRPGGRLVILEITQPQRPPLSTFFSLWFDRVVPVLGRFAGDSAAYSYLPDSVRSFPAPDRLAELLAAAGLGRIRWLLLAGGIIAIHSGAKGP
ncbi:MAG: bifunctional demethylmenaquinone methyltransferase/2-methoxy-6-polyprenyl-1,4-benzoquinol methylase UbiE [Solirubrobacterales bacterium]